MFLRKRAAPLIGAEEQTAHATGAYAQHACIFFVDGDFELD
jgi:hypothetical protein